MEKLIEIVARVKTRWPSIGLGQLIYGAVAEPGMTEQAVAARLFYMHDDALVAALTAYDQSLHDRYTRHEA